MPGRLVFSVTADGSASPTEALRITNDRYVRLASGSGGIQFNGDTAAANALDDYEEGTFTPVIEGATTVGTGTYTIQNGEYVKVGRQVHVNLRIDWTAHTGTGILKIAGLPFTASNRNSGSNIYSLSSFLSRVDVGASGTAPMLYVAGDTSWVQGRGFINDQLRTNIDVNSDASGSTLAVSGSYQV
jgi:hypothetical protein